MGRKLQHLAVAVAVATLLTGCDDPMGYDLTEDGRVVVALDAEGKAALLADGTKPRSLVVIDPKTGKREAFTKKPGPYGAPRALPGGNVLVVEGRKKLVVLDKEGARRQVLEATGKRIFMLPAVSPDGKRAAVVEATRWGERGDLRVIDLSTGTELSKVENALAGAAWVGGKDAPVLVATRVRELRLAIEDEKTGALPMKIDADFVRIGTSGETKTVSRVSCAFAVPVSGLGKRAFVILPREDREVLQAATLDLDTGSLQRIDLGGKGAVAFAAASPDGKRVLFTRSGGKDDDASLEGELLLAPADDLAAAKPVPTPGPVSAPRWLSEDRITFLAQETLVAQGLKGEDRLTLARAGSAQGKGEK